jgi:hypothetical protein
LSDATNAIVGTVPLIVGYGITKAVLKETRGRSRSRSKGGYCPICKAHFPNLKAHMKRDMEHSGRYGRRHRTYYERHLQ